MGLAQHLLDLGNQVQELQQRVAQLEATLGPTQPTGPYLGPAISQRVHEALWQAGFDTIQKLREASDEDLLATRGIGKGTVRLIREAL